MEIVSTPTHTDGGAVGVGGFVLTTAEVSSDGPSDSTGRLLGKFKVIIIIVIIIRIRILIVRRSRRRKQ